MGDDRRRVGYAGLFLFLIVAGCQGESEPEQPKGPNTCEGCPVISLGDEVERSPDGAYLVDFGKVEVGEEVQTAFELLNLTEEEVLLSNVGPDAPFALVLEEVLPPAAMIELVLIFEPSAAGLYAGEILIEADDTKLVLDLRGEGIGEPDRRCEWMVEDEPLVFTVGEGLLEEPGTGRIWLENTGDGSCLLSNIRVEGSEAFSTPYEGESISIPGGSSWAITVSFAPLPDAEGVLLFDVDGEEGRVALGTATEPRCAYVVELDQTPALGVGCPSNAFMVVGNRCDRTLQGGEHSWDSPGIASFAIGPIAAGGEGAVVAAPELQFFYGEGSPGELLLSFDNGDRLSAPLSPVPSRITQVYLFEDRQVAAGGAGMSWDMPELFEDLNEDGRYDAADGVRVLLNGEVSVPAVSESGFWAWKINWEGPLLNVLSGQVPMGPGDWLTLQAPRVCSVHGPGD